MTNKQTYTEADLQISKIAKFERHGDVISHTHTVVFERPLTVAERHLFVDVLNGFYYTVHFSQQFDGNFAVEPKVEFESPSLARYTFQQTSLSGEWKELLFAVLFNFSHEVAPIALHDESRAFAPQKVPAAAD